MANLSIEGVQDILLAAEGAGETKTAWLSASLARAISSLNQTFGAGGETVSGVPAEGQSDQYAQMFSEIAENFSTLFAELSKMRSSYLPFSLAEQIVSGIPDSEGGEDRTLGEVVDAEAILESYENTFFRLLGMPSSSDIDETDALIMVGDSGTFYGEEAAINQRIYLRTLDTRQLARSDRPRTVDNTVYDMITSSISLTTRLTDLGAENIEALYAITGHLRTLKDTTASDDIRNINEQIKTVFDDNIAFGGDDESRTRWVETFTQDLESFHDAQTGVDSVRSLGDPMSYLYSAWTWMQRLINPALMAHPEYINLINQLWGKEVLGESDSSILDVWKPDNFWKYSYLLFPPIQDGRIGQCINEPSKMVAAPFTPKTLRTINGRPLKSTLLEAIIRIRLDTNSGSTVNKPNLSQETGAPVTVGSSRRPLRYGEIEEAMGLLESLIITRLFSAMHGFAIDVRNKIKEMHALQHQSGHAPVPNTDPETDNGAAQHERKKFCEASVERCRLETAKLIEDSLLLILGDNEVPEVLDLQEGVARNSSVRTAHLMSSVLSIIDVPRKWIDKELEALDERDTGIADKGSDSARAQIGSKLGIAKGVGAVDVLAFLIALFTVEEEYLLGLLTSEQYENLKAEFPSGFFEKFDLKKPKMSKAVRQVSTRAYDAYQLFRFAFLNPGGTFVYM